MDAHKLRLFIALADSRHFGRAAAQCHVSPSTVSRNLKQLEDDLGSLLMLRDNRSVALTADGERFLQFAREALQHWETFQQSLQNHSEQLRDRKSTRLNSSHVAISYAVFCFKKKSCPSLY